MTTKQLPERTSSRSLLLFSFSGARGWELIRLTILEFAFGCSVKVCPVSSIRGLMNLYMLPPWLPNHAIVVRSLWVVDSKLPLAQLCGLGFIAIQKTWKRHQAVCSPQISLFSIPRFMYPNHQNRQTYLPPSVFFSVVQPVPS